MLLLFNMTPYSNDHMRRNQLYVHTTHLKYHENIINNVKSTDFCSTQIKYLI